MIHRMSASERLESAYRDMADADVEHLVTIYTPDAIIQAAGAKPVVGLDAIRAFWIATFEQYAVELVPEVLEEEDLGPVVVVRGRASGTMRPRSGGSPARVDTWFMQIHRRAPDGALLFWRGANGPNPPAVAPP